MKLDTNGEAVGEYVTGRNGYAVVPELEPGFYTIKEVRAPDGYILSGAPQTIEIREGKPAQVEFVNTRKEPLQILKVDAETGDPLLGAVFTITRTSGEPVGDRYTTVLNDKREQQDAAAMGSQNRAWVQVFAQYENVQELDRRLLLALVDRILIYEDKKVEIVFRYRDEFARAMETAKNYKDCPLPAVG